jgi:hypothetical protein
MERLLANLSLKASRIFFMSYAVNNDTHRRGVAMPPRQECLIPMLTNI